MTTDWIRKHVNPDLVARYEAEMTKIRGEAGNKEHVVKNVEKMQKEMANIVSKKIKNFK